MSITIKWNAAVIIAMSTWVLAVQDPGFLCVSNHDLTLQLQHTASSRCALLPPLDAGRCSQSRTFTAEYYYCK